MQSDSSFNWACPKCGHPQTETVTIDGPVMSLICESCTQDFAAGDLPLDVLTAWYAAIDAVIPA
jgi:hypothetical protein